MYTSRRQKLLQAGVAAIAVASLSAQGANWWVESKSDSQWTNRPLPEMLSEAQGTNALAQFYYARAAFCGNGRPRDLQESLTWLTRSAALGLADAQYMLSRCYLSGTGVATDPEAGVQWAGRAAEQGHADALAVLGDAQGYGYGTAQDVVKSRQNFQRAIDGGSTLALDWFGHFLMGGEARTAAKTNYPAALQCFERAASNGMTHAVAHLVDFYLKGLGSPPNTERAVLLARQAVDNNDVELMEKLAGLYGEGIAQPRDASETALELFRRAAETRASSFDRFEPKRQTLRDLQALKSDAAELCNRYRFGLGTSRDYISFAQWLFVQKQAEVWTGEVNTGRAATELENPHLFDQIVAGKVPGTASEDQRIREAATRVHRALEAVDANACREIGEMYRHGSSLTPESPLLAWLWLNRSAELKSSDGATALREVEGTLSSEQISKLRRRYLPQANRQP